MSEQSVAPGPWSYRPGPWFAIIGTAATLLLPGAEKRRAAELWARIDDGEGFEAVLDALLESGLGALPAFMLIGTEGVDSRVLVRGAAARGTAQTADGEVTLEGRPSTTWTEHTLRDVTSVVVDIVEGDPAAEGAVGADDLAVTGGLIRVSRIARPATSPEQVEDLSEDVFAPAPLAAAPAVAATGLEPESPTELGAEADGPDLDGPDLGQAELETADPDQAEEPAYAEEVPSMPPPSMPPPSMPPPSMPPPSMPPPSAPPAPSWPQAAAPTAMPPEWADDPAPSQDSFDQTVETDEAVDEVVDAPEESTDALSDPDWEQPDTAAPDEMVDSEPLETEAPEPVETAEPETVELETETETEAEFEHEPAADPDPDPDPWPQPLATDESVAPPPAFGEMAPPVVGDQLTPAADHDGMTQIGESNPDLVRAQPGIPGQPMAPHNLAEPVARLMISHGETVDVDRVVLIGRAPEARRFTTTDQPLLVTVPSPLHEISSTHVEIRPGSGADHGSAVVTDMGSTNGTVLEQPGLGPEELRPGIAVQLIPGATINLGDGVTITVTRP